MIHPMVMYQAVDKKTGFNDGERCEVCSGQSDSSVESFSECDVRHRWMLFRKLLD